MICFEIKSFVLLPRAGREIGIKSMKRGEVAHFLIAYDYAYGEMGCPPRVPPKSMVFFEVELIHFHDEAKVRRRGFGS